MIEIKNLKKSFGTQEVLKGVSLTISEGEIVFILGASGTGKSVLLKILVGLLKASSGEVLIDGQNIIGLTEEDFFSIRQKCGMVFQQPALFDSLNVYDNVAYGLRRQAFQSKQSESEKVKECLRLVHLQDIEAKLPQEISYGMQKRVSLARTIAVSPQILLFDEPTTGLDPITTSAINSLILELSRTLKTTSIVVSHDMDCALAIADKIIVLDKGQIIAEGSPQEIIKSEHQLVKAFMLEAKKDA